MRVHAGRLGFALAIGALGSFCASCDKSPFESDRPVSADPMSAPPMPRGRGPAIDFDGGIVLERSDPPRRPAIFATT